MAWVVIVSVGGKWEKCRQRSSKKKDALRSKSMTFKLSSTSNSHMHRFLNVAHHCSYANSVNGVGRKIYIKVTVKKSVDCTKKRLNYVLTNRKRCRVLDKLLSARPFVRLLLKIVRMLGSAENA